MKIRTPNRGKAERLSHMHQAFTGETVEPLTQTTRLGVAGKPSGSGFDQPIQVPQLEAEYYASRGH